MKTIEEPVPESNYFSGLIEELNEPRNGVALELSFINPNNNLIPVGVAQQEGYHHYFRGNEAAKWLSCVPHYKELLYHSVWDGVDLEVTANKDGMKMNWLLDMSARISSIRLHWAGAESLELDTDGNLLVHHALGTLTDLAPIAYQEINGIRIPVNYSYRLYDNFEYGFELTGDYSTGSPLVIDPILQYATYLGGSLIQIGESIAAVDQGHGYVTGRTLSINFPLTPGAFQTTLPSTTSSSGFITKFSPDGSSLIYSTYLGGSNTDVSNGIAIDTQRHAYVTGISSSTDFPVTPGAFQTSFINNAVFVTKLSIDGGSLVYSTFLAGNGNDENRKIALIFYGKGPC